MKNNINPHDIPNHVFEILGNKPFDMLSDVEQKLILSYMTKDDFQSYSRLINDFKAEKVEVEKDAKSLVKYTIWEKPIPLYQVLIGMIILICFFLSYLHFSTKEAENQEISTSGKSMADDEYPDNLIFVL